MNHIETQRALKHWVLHQYEILGKALPDLDSKWFPLKGDAGFRQYFRIEGNPNVIAVFAPPETEDSAQFIQVANYFRDGGVNTPHIMASDLTRGFLLIEDLGETTYFDHLNRSNVETLYGRALDALIEIQSLPKNEAIFASYDEQQLSAEMALFPTWFVEQLLDYSMSSQEKALFNEFADKLNADIVLQPQVAVHRDFHSQNILYSHAGSPGIIDFQDALWGPITYDLVSLLRDCYVCWDTELVTKWALSYAKKLEQAEICGELNSAQFMRWFDWTGLQRHVKVLGIFARLSLRDNKHKYLNDLPLVVHYFVSIVRKYPELSDFAVWFEKRLTPLIQEQSWMQRSNINENKL